MQNEWTRNNDGSFVLFSLFHSSVSFAMPSSRKGKFLAHHLHYETAVHLELVLGKTLSNQFLTRLFHVESNTTVRVVERIENSEGTQEVTVTFV